MLQRNFGRMLNRKRRLGAESQLLRSRKITEAATASDKAETLNKYFRSTSTEERLEVIPSNTNNQFLGEYLDTFEITPQMILEKLQDLNPEKSPGPNGWHPVLLKKLSISYQHSSSYPISKIFKRKPSTFSMVRGLCNSHKQERS